MAFPRRTDAIYFYDEKKTHREFSNFYKCQVVYPGITGKVYPSSEHAYQAAKFLGPDAAPIDHDFAEVIRTTDNPNKIFVLARQKKVGGYKWKTDLNPIIEKHAAAKPRSDWDQVRVAIMTDIVRAKFTQNNRLRELLIATGDKHIYEDSPRDSFWGVGADGNGENALGKILMVVRSELRQ